MAETIENISSNNEKTNQNREEGNHSCRSGGVKEFAQAVTWRTRIKGKPEEDTLEDNT